MSKASRLSDPNQPDSKAPRASSKARTREAEALPELLAGLNVDRIVADLQAMIAIPSVNPFDEEPRAGFREREMGTFYCDRMSDLGLESVALSAHTDLTTNDAVDELKRRIDFGKMLGVKVWLLEIPTACHCTRRPKGESVTGSHTSKGTRGPICCSVGV